MFRRLIAPMLVLSMLVASIPAPALALNTNQEIQLGKDSDKQIVESQGVVGDPLLNAWVNDVAKRLWTQVKRTDIPYNIKIIDSTDINAFTTLGGYIYVNEGTLDFAQSDDELASVIGHETGHEEHRHTVTFANKAQILNILFGIGAMFSPFLYRFGQLAQAGLLAKQSRIDELEADRYGLHLISSAGYDPDAAISFMRHLGALHDDHSDLVNKYFEDHPGVPDRVAHLLGYPELDPKMRTNDQLLVQAIHDQETARYNIAALKFAQILKTDPNNTIALLHLGQVQVALGQLQKSEQNLAEAAGKGNAETKAAATLRIEALRQQQERFNPTKPNLQPLRDQIAAAQRALSQTAGAVASRRDGGRDQIKALQGRLQSISYEIPDFSRMQIRKDSRLDTIVHNLTAMGRSVNSALEKSGEVIGGVGSLERNKENGLLRENSEILKDMGAPLTFDPVPAQSLSVLPLYPKMLSDINLAGGDMIRSVDAARSSLAILDVSLGDLDKFLKALTRVSLDFGGDVTPNDYNTLLPMMKSASESLSHAAVGASQADQLYNMARARQLQTRINMLGLGYPADRYASLQHALDVRFHNTGMTFDDMERAGLSPGEVTAATIVAADTNSSVDAVVAEAKSSGRSIVDVANARGMHAMALEIFLGLVYLDYTDDPAKEAHPVQSERSATLN